MAKLATQVYEVSSAVDIDVDSSRFVEQDGLTYAGRHLLIDLWQAERLSDARFIEETLTRAVAAAGATLLRIDLHTFTENGGISGVAILAESHMSIHTWPELGYAALDVFVCGKCDPNKAVPILREAFNPGNLQISEHKRGLMP